MMTTPPEVAILRSLLEQGWQWMLIDDDLYMAHPEHPAMVFRKDAIYPEIPNIQLSYLSTRTCARN